MIIVSICRVILDPVTEFDLICQYKSDTNWKCVSESTVAIVFEQKLESHIMKEKVKVDDL